MVGLIEPYINMLTFLLFVFGHKSITCTDENTCK